jgi:hypothetical protein
VAPPSSCGGEFGHTCGANEHINWLFGSAPHFARLTCSSLHSKGCCLAQVLSVAATNFCSRKTSHKLGTNFHRHRCVTATLRVVVCGWQPQQTYQPNSSQLLVAAAAWRGKVWPEPNSLEDVWLPADVRLTTDAAATRARQLFGSCRHTPRH